jgi:hypothetical protein
MVGRKTVDVVNITIPNGVKSETVNSKRLDRGAYSRFQIIKLNAKAKEVQTQIEITDGTDDLISRSSVEGYTRSGGKFMESMAKITLPDDTEVTVSLTADTAVDGDAVFQILFFKKPECDA